MHTQRHADRLCDWNFYARRGDLTLFNLLTYLTHRRMHAHTHTQTIVGKRLQIKNIHSNREGRDDGGDSCVTRRKETDVDGDRNGFTMDHLIGLHASHVQPESLITYNSLII